jgi:hypothetical protein
LAIHRSGPAGDLPDLHARYRRDTAATIDAMAQRYSGCFRTSAPAPAAPAVPGQGTPPHRHNRH